MSADQWPESICPGCGEDFDGIEVEECECGGCEMCCTCEEDNDVR